MFSQLLSYAFRPFFLLGSLFTIIVMLLWVLALAGIGPVALHASPMLWHAHEMLFGFAMAIIAGFVLTAVAVWTGRTRLHGAPLGWLIVAWLAGRGAMSVSGALPAAVVGLLDMVFPVLVCLFFGREVLAAGNRRNYVVVGIVVAIAILNVLYHVGAAGVAPGLDRTALLLMIHVVLVLITAIGGRIVPSFTANWLRARGQERFPRTSATIDAVTLALTVVAGIAITLAPQSPMTGIIALVTAVAHGLRLSRWSGLATTAEPMLFVLHVAYLWFPIGYLLVAWSALGSMLGSVYPPSVALHALTMGAIGTMVLAMSTRVSLGHTGRVPQAARLTVIGYYLLNLAVIIRLVGPLFGAQYMRSVEVAAVAWITTFLLFLWVYWPILTQPRAD